MAGFSEWPHQRLPGPGRTPLGQSTRCRGQEGHSKLAAPEEPGMRDSPAREGRGGWRRGCSGPGLGGSVASQAVTWALSPRGPDQSRVAELGGAYPGWARTAGMAGPPETQCRPGQWAPGLAGRPDRLQTRSDQEGGQAVWTGRPCPRPRGLLAGPSSRPHLELLCAGHLHLALQPLVSQAPVCTPHGQLAPGTALEHPQLALV